MTWGPKQVWGPFTIASAASTGSIIDLGDKSYRQMAVYASPMGTDLNIYVGDQATRMAPMRERVNTSTVQYQQVFIASAASGSWAVTPAAPLRYLQFVGTGTAANGAQIYVAFDD